MDNSEPVLPPSREGSVVLDIGGDVGALIVHTPAGLLGTEPELAFLDDPGRHVHTAVRERRTGNEVSYAAVYPSLVAGRYQLADTGQVVTIEGGAITEIAWAGEAKDVAG